MAGGSKHEGSGLSSRCASIAGVMALAALLLMPQVACAQNYPNRPVRLIVPFGPGGVADVTARIVTEKLGEKLGQRFVIENMPGAGGINAARAVLSAPPDGHTLALFSNGTAISVSLFKDLKFDPLTDFVPVSSMGYFDFIFVTQAGSPYRTLADFIKAAKQKPGALNVGTINVGSTQNLSAQLFKSTAGVDVTIVPFRSSPEVLVALLRGDIQLAIENYTIVQSQHRRQGADGGVDIRFGPHQFPARRADGEGSRRRRVRGAVLERDLRAQGHAAGGDRDAQCRAARGARRRRN